MSGVGYRVAMRTILLALFVTSGCADIAPIEDGKTYGSVVTIKDLFTSLQEIECEFVRVRH